MKEGGGELCVILVSARLRPKRRKPCASRKKEPSCYSNKESPTFWEDTKLPIPQYKVHMMGAILTPAQVVHAGPSHTAPSRPLPNAHLCGGAERWKSTVVIQPLLLCFATPYRRWGLPTFDLEHFSYQLPVLRPVFSRSGGPKASFFQTVSGPLGQPGCLRISTGIQTR